MNLHPTPSGQVAMCRPERFINAVVLPGENLQAAIDGLRAGAGGRVLLLPGEHCGGGLLLRDNSSAIITVFRR